MGLRPFPIGKVLSMALRVWLVAVVFPAAIVGILVWFLQRGQGEQQKVPVSLDHALQHEQFQGEPTPSAPEWRRHSVSHLGFSVEMPDGEGWVVKKGVTKEVILKSVNPDVAQVFIYDLGPWPFPEDVDPWALRLSDTPFLMKPGSLNLLAPVMDHGTKDIGTLHGLWSRLNLGTIGNETQYVFPRMGRIVKISSHERTLAERVVDSIMLSPSDSR